MQLGPGAASSASRKPLVVGLVHGAVQEILAALAVARGREGHRQVEGVPLHDRGDGVVEVEPARPTAWASHSARGSAVRGPVARREAGRVSGRAPARSPPSGSADARATARDRPGEGQAVHGEGIARRDAGLPGAAEDQRIQALQLGLEDARGAGGIVALEGMEQTISAA